MTYRPEIDGLRAIAVLPVILYHAGFTLFSGGFTGVDVFFVISGYLITGILLDDLRQGRFSLADFYERRARRILPALFTVVLATLPFAYTLMLPEQLADFSASLLAVLLALSNLYFLSEIDYFAPAADLQPLLHTWSLAVEEQYYLLFPLLLLATRRLKPRTTTLIVAALVLASFAFAEWAWRENAARSFYFTLSRLWEIGAGSLVACLTAGKPPRANNALAAAGLALIVASVFAFDTATPFPGAYTLVPVTGAALVLVFARQGTWVASLLSLRGIVGIGLISYSAYLWHQPLFAFARLHSFTEPDRGLMAALAALSLGLAWLTWRYVEQPFRTRRLLATRRSVLSASAIAAAAFLTLGLTGYLTRGFEGRLTPLQRDMIAQSLPTRFGCPGPASCLMGDTTGRFTAIAFIGDSHTGRYGYHLDQILASQNRSARILTHSACAPLLFWHTGETGLCGGSNREKFDHHLRAVLTDPAVQTVVLGARWGNYAGPRKGLNTIAFDFTGDTTVNADPTTNSVQFQKAFTATIAAFRQAGKAVVVIAPVPEYDYDVPLVALRLADTDADRTAFALPRQAYDQRNAAVFAAFATNAAHMQVIDVWPLLCATDSCLPFDDRGFPLYNDTNHLSRLGTPPVIDKLRQTLGL